MKGKRGILLFLVVFLLSCFPVFALSMPSLNFDVSSFYNSYWQIIDVVLYFTLLLAITNAGLSKAMDNKHSTKIAVVISLIGSISLLFTEIGIGRKLVDFGSYFVIFIAVLLGIVVYKIVLGSLDGKGIGFKDSSKWSRILAIIMAIVVVLLILSFFDGALNLGSARGKKVNLFPIPMAEFLGKFVLVAIVMFIFFLMSKLGGTATGHGPGGRNNPNVNLGPITKRVKSLENNMGNINQSFSTLKNEIMELKTSFASLQAEFAAIQNRITGWKERVDRIDAFLNNLREQLRINGELSEKDRANLEILKETVSALENDLPNLEKAIMERIERLDSGLEKTNNNLNDLTEKVKEGFNDVEELKRRIVTIESNIDKIPEKIQEEVRTKLAGIEAEIATLKERINRLSIDMDISFREINQKIKDIKVTGKLSDDEFKKIVEKIRITVRNMIRKIDKEKSGKGGNKYEVTIFGQAVFENNAEVSQELGLFSGKIETLNELIKSLGLDKIVAQLDLLKNESNATAIITQDLTKKMKALEKEIKENVKVNSDKIKDLEKVVKKEEKFVLKELNQARELDAIVGVEDLEERKEEFRKKLRSIKRTEYKERRRASVERIKNYTLALGNAKINNHIMRVEQKMESLEKFSLKEVSERLNKMTEGNAISWPSVQTETSNFVTQLNGWEVLIKELKEFISRLK